MILKMDVDNLPQYKFVKDKQYLSGYHPAYVKQRKQKLVGKSLLDIAKGKHLIKSDL